MSLAASEFALLQSRDKERAIARLAAVPRLRYGCYPTPIEELPRLRAKLGGGPRLFVKRDDYTGPGFGGNKVRKLEFELAQAVINGAEAVITIGGGEKSNHARVTAALCARIGLHCILVVNSTDAEAEHSSLKPASMHLDEMFGAEVHRVSRREERAPFAAAIAERLRSEGREVAQIPLGASTPLGALGFVSAIQELELQFKRISSRPTYVFHASTSGGTQAGIIVGCQLFDFNDVRIVGVSPDDTNLEISTEVARIIAGSNELLGLPTSIAADDVMVLDQFIGEGYGIDTRESVSAMELLARTEGIILDPVYTSKAMAALVEWVRQGKLTEEDTVLFWHTGGQLAMFYSQT